MPEANDTAEGLEDPGEAAQEAQVALQAQLAAAIPAQPAAVSVDTPEQSVGAIIQAWLRVHIYDTVVAREVSVINHIHSVVGHLEADLNEFISKIEGNK
jgi:hypothetical protein